MNTPNFPRTHISLYVSDLAKTVRFYNTFFGRPADKIKPGYAKYLLTDPALVISFIEHPERVRAGFGHLGFQVATKAELESLLEKARAQGLVGREETGVACCYAVQDKFWVHDPDGVEWEVYYFHKDAEWNDPRYETPPSGGCCTSSQKNREAAPEALQESCCTTGICC